MIVYLWNMSDDGCLFPTRLRFVDNYYVQPVDPQAATALSYGARIYSSFRIIKVSFWKKNGPRFAWKC